MANSAFIKNDVVGSVILNDGATAQLTVPYEKGGVKVGPLKQILNEHNKYVSRGRLRGVGVGDRIFPALEFAAWLTELTNATAHATLGNVVDFLLKRGAYAANVSTLGANHPIYAVHVTLNMEGTNFGDDADMALKCENVVPPFDFAESMEGNAIAVSGEVLGRVLLNGVVLAQEVQ